MTRIAVIDHGAGNLVSMERAFERVGAKPVLVKEAADLAPFDGVVLPGVGATGAAMRTLHQRHLVEPIRNYGGPLLGVCVGMQLLFDHSDEDDNRCLGILPGNVRVLGTTPLPHMGWNEVAHHEDPLLERLGPTPSFYFVHSYCVAPDDPGVVAGLTAYGSDTFPSMIRSGPVVGVQFHPERSAHEGLMVLDNFVRACGEARRVA